MINIECQKNEINLQTDTKVLNYAYSIPVLISLNNAHKLLYF